MLKIYNYKEKLDKHLSYKVDENIRHVFKIYRQWSRFKSANYLYSDKHKYLISCILALLQLLLNFRNDKRLLCFLKTSKKCRIQNSKSNMATY